jgi:hypothetical protein
MTADTQRRRHRSQGGRRRPAIHGALADPDDQRAVVLAAHAETGRAGPHPDGNAHHPSVCPALAVGTGLQVMAAMFEQDVTALCGPGGKHNRGRTGYRHGTGAGSVTLGGRRLPVTRPRVRAADGAGELRLPSYDLFSCTEILGEVALEKMLAGLSSRRYERGLEPAGTAVEEAATATSKSAVSRRFVVATETALEQLMSRRLDDLDLVAFMVEGVHFGEHTCVVALGIGHRRHEVPAGRGGGLDRERDPGHRPDHRAARPRAGCHPAGPGRAGRVEGPGQGGEGRV